MMLSIIVPIYNVDKYLEDCIESILNQEYIDFELILINDGSTDNSDGICKKYVELDSRIRYISKENEGISKTRNLGIRLARGRYIGFVDSDDYIDSSMYSYLMKFSLEKNADIVQCDYSNISANQVRTIVKNGKNSFCDEYKIINNYEMISNSFNKGQGVLSSVLWNKVYKKELFNGIEFPNNRIHEDESVIYKLYYNAKKIILLNKKLYFYRRRDFSIMNAVYDKERLDILSALEEKMYFFKEKDGWEQVYRASIKDYCYYIIQSYYLYYKSHPKDKETLYDIKRRGNEVRRKCILTRKVGIVAKLKIIIFKFYPNIGKVISGFK